MSDLDTIVPLQAPQKKRKSHSSDSDSDEEVSAGRPKKTAKKSNTKNGKPAKRKQSAPRQSLEDAVLNLTKETKDFEVAVKELSIVGYYMNEKKSGECVCGQKHLKHEFYVGLTLDQQRFDDLQIGLLNWPLVKPKYEYNMDEDQKQRKRRLDYFCVRSARYDQIEQLTLQSKYMKYIWHKKPDPAPRLEWLCIGSKCIEKYFPSSSDTKRLKKISEEIKTQAGACHAYVSMVRKLQGDQVDFDWNEEHLKWIEGTAPAPKNIECENPIHKDRKKRDAFFAKRFIESNGIKINLCSECCELFLPNVRCSSCAVEEVQPGTRLCLSCGLNRCAACKTFTVASIWNHSSFLCTDHSNNPPRCGACGIICNELVCASCKRKEKKCRRVGCEEVHYSGSRFCEGCQMECIECNQSVDTTTDGKCDTCRYTHACQKCSERTETKYCGRHSKCQDCFRPISEEHDDRLCNSCWVKKKPSTRYSNPSILKGRRLGNGDTVDRYIVNALEKLITKDMPIKVRQDLHGRTWKDVRWNIWEHGRAITAFVDGFPIAYDIIQRRLKQNYTGTFISDEGSVGLPAFRELNNLLTAK